MLIHLKYDGYITTTSITSLIAYPLMKAEDVIIAEIITYQAKVYCLWKDRVQQMMSVERGMAALDLRQTARLITEN